MPTSFAMPSRGPACRLSIGVEPQWCTNSILLECDLPPARTRCTILLHSRSAQAGQAVVLECTFPRQEFFLRQLVVAAGFLDRNAAAAYRGDHRRLAADHPSFGVRRRQALHDPGSDGWLTRKGLDSAVRGN